MPRLWERSFIIAARFFAWCVAAIPFVLALVLCVAIALGSPGNLMHALPLLASQTFVTVLVGAAGAFIGAIAGAGSAVFSHETLSGRAAWVVRASDRILGIAPAVVLGWFGVALLSLQRSAPAPAAVLLVAILVVALMVVPEAYVFGARCVRALPPELRHAAAALGASPQQTRTHVIVPAAANRFTGIYFSLLSRALVESAGVSIVFFYAARFGFGETGFSLGAWLIATPLQAPVSATMAVAALLLLIFSAVTRLIGAAGVGELEWA